ncbi:MAG: SDR family oxidoreductase [Rhodobacteraceae bacterium]|nr:SDR family oxidoreductase [Paracoccaceae bacterium]
MTDQKIALVTGASRGFGAAVAEELARAGYHVVAVARTQGGLEELDDRITAAGGHATLAPMDIAEVDAMRALCRGIYDRWGKLDLWVHAAIQTPALSPTEQVDAGMWDRLVPTNIHATGVLITFIAPLLRAAGGGRAVLIDDTASGPFMGAYTAAKAAQRALFTAWSQEQARLQDVRIAMFEPAPMATAHRQRFYPGEDKSVLALPADEARRMLDTLSLG